MQGTAPGGLLSELVIGGRRRGEKRAAAVHNTKWKKYRPGHRHTDPQPLAESGPTHSVLQLVWFWASHLLPCVCSQERRCPTAWGRGVGRGYTWWANSKTKRERKLSPSVGKGGKKLWGTEEQVAERGTRIQPKTKDFTEAITSSKGQQIT